MTSPRLAHASIDQGGHLRGEITMGEPVTQLQFYEEMQKLRGDFQVMQTLLRGSMTEGFTGLSDKLDAHAKDDAAVEKRVTRIEIERQGEQNQAMKRGTWAAMIGAAGLTAAWEAVKHVAGWR